MYTALELHFRLQYMFIKKIFKKIETESLCPWIWYTFWSVFIPHNFLLSGYIHQQNTCTHTHKKSLSYAVV